MTPIALDPPRPLDGLLLRLRLQHLRMLVALSESVSIDAAAQRMHLTQSAASKLLGDMERAFARGCLTAGVSACTQLRRAKR